MVEYLVYSQLASLLEIGSVGTGNGTSCLLINAESSGCRSAACSFESTKLTVPSVIAFCRAATPSIN